MTKLIAAFHNFTIFPRQHRLSKVLYFILLRTCVAGSTSATYDLLHILMNSKSSCSAKNINLYSLPWNRRLTSTFYELTWVLSSDIRAAYYRNLFEYNFVRTSRRSRVCYNSFPLRLGFITNPLKVQFYVSSNIFVVYRPVEEIARSDKTRKILTFTFLRIMWFMDST